MAAVGIAAAEVSAQPPRGINRAEQVEPIVHWTEPSSAHYFDVPRRRMKARSMSGRSGPNPENGMVAPASFARFPLREGVRGSREKMGTGTWCRVWREQEKPTAGNEWSQSSRVNNPSIELASLPRALWQLDRVSQTRDPR
jgi:hypothetical protein